MPSTSLAAAATYGLALAAALSLTATAQPPVGVPGGQPPSGGPPSGGPPVFPPVAGHELPPESVTGFQPEPWPTQFFALFNREVRSKTGDFIQYETREKYYDATNLRKLEHCQSGGFSSSVLFVNRTAWIWSGPTRKCYTSRVPVPIVRPDWMIGGEFVGVETVNGVPSYRWEKLNHTYWAEVGTKNPMRPVKLFAPLDQNSNMLYDSYSIFEPNTLRGEQFNIPDFCQDAKVLGRNELPDDPDANLRCFFPQLVKKQ
ncbi:hypothetical protein HK102_003627 [Quaeritorhiza haematococci]|nr:hypothetical protein HK102_003627 [Quaeritorhiza haematococci]